MSQSFLSEEESSDSSTSSSSSSNLVKNTHSLSKGKYSVKEGQIKIAIKSTFRSSPKASLLQSNQSLSQSQTPAPSPNALTQTKADTPSFAPSPSPTPTPAFLPSPFGSLYGINRPTLQQIHFREAATLRSLEEKWKQSE